MRDKLFRLKRRIHYAIVNWLWNFLELQDALDEVQRDCENRLCDIDFPVTQRDIDFLQSQIDDIERDL